MKQKRPQLLPTRRLRSFVEKLIRLLDRLPLVGPFIRGPEPTERSEVALTLVIPLHPKDLWIASHAVSFARENLWHPIEEILVVSPRDEEIQAWIEKANLVWVAESEVLNYSKKYVEDSLPESLQDRSGWIFQQLLKFGLVSRIKTEAFLVIDADTLLLRPKVFLQDGVPHLGYSHERNLLYQKSYRYLLGQRCRSLRSYVTHFMFGEKTIVKELLDCIEKKSGKPWDQTIIDLATSEIWTERERSIWPFNYFSEYETYANFSLGHYKKVKRAYFRNHGAREYDPRIEGVSDYVSRLPVFFQWASFHSYYDYQEELCEED